jgi:hypothetical protein
LPRIIPRMAVPVGPQPRLQPTIYLPTRTRAA